MRIPLDMDDVLVDFVGGAAALWGLTTEDLLPYWDIGVWDVVPPLGRALHARDGTHPNGMGVPEFWAKIGGHPGFWEDLRPLPWCDSLLTLVASFTDDWYIVSSPSRAPSSWSGKVRWLKDYFGEEFNRIVLTRHKHLLAGPGVVLIDDRESNVLEFTTDRDGRPTGGDGVVFPKYHNRNHAHRADPVRYVRTVLEYIATNEPRRRCKAPGGMV
jgi:5'(3')-deoxyribonucleotidase